MVSITTILKKRVSPALAAGIAVFLIYLFNGLIAAQVKEIGIVRTATLKVQSEPGKHGILQKTLKKAMIMTGCKNLSDISSKCLNSDKMILTD